METLLSSAFDLLSSYDPIHIRKGIRHLEGLLAKMCLAPSVTKEGEAGPPRKPEDPVFREFIKLQNGFEWNGTHTHALALHDNVNRCDYEDVD